MFLLLKYTPTNLAIKYGYVLSMCNWIVRSDIFKDHFNSIENMKIL